MESFQKALTVSSIISCCRGLCLSCQPILAEISTVKTLPILCPNNSLGHKQAFYFKGNFLAKQRKNIFAIGDKKTDPTKK
jgi:hypothetical protein